MINTSSTIKEERISKGTGRFMILIALVFDTIPIFLIVFCLFLMLYPLGSGVLEDVTDLSQSTNFFTEWKNKVEIGVGVGAEIAGIMAFLFFIAPILYTIGSFFSVIIGYLLFTFWFMFRGVNIWSFTKIQRLFATGITLVVESIPLLNLLPGTTLMVWRHVKITQLEDRTEEIKPVLTPTHITSP